MQDKGGRTQWAGYSAVSSSGAGASGSTSSLGRGVNTGGSSSSSSKPLPASASNTNVYAQPKYQAGYAPARTPSPVTQPQAHHYSPQQQSQAAPAAAAALPAGGAAATTSVSTMLAQGNIVTRVRALHTFEPTEPGELAFEKGDIIKVVDRGYKDWWRGQLKGRTGIFPVNYVVRARTLGTGGILPHHSFFSHLGGDARAHCSRVGERG